MGCDSPHNLIGLTINDWITLWAACATSLCLNNRSYTSCEAVTRSLMPVNWDFLPAECTCHVSVVVHLAVCNYESQQTIGHSTTYFMLSGMIDQAMNNPCLTNKPK